MRPRAVRSAPGESRATSCGWRPKCSGVWTQRCWRDSSSLTAPTFCFRLSQQLLEEEELRTLQQEALEVLWEQLRKTRDEVLRISVCQQTRAAITIQRHWRAFRSRRVCVFSCGPVQRCCCLTASLLAAASPRHRRTTFIHHIAARCLAVWIALGISCILPADAFTGVMSRRLCSGDIISPTASVSRSLSYPACRKL